MDLNIAKTKELMFEFRRKGLTAESIVHNECVEIVPSYKYLGTFFDNQLTLDVNTAALETWTAKT